MANEISNCCVKLGILIMTMYAVLCDSVNDMFH
jgi:hypothetical protein